MARINKPKMARYYYHEHQINNDEHVYARYDSQQHEVIAITINNQTGQTIINKYADVPSHWMVGTAKKFNVAFQQWLGLL